MKIQFVCLFMLLNCHLSSSAQITFQETFGRNGMDAGYSVVQTADGGYAIGGYIDVDNSAAENNDVCLIRTDSNGDTLWTKLYGGIQDERAYSVQQTSDGGFILCGITESFGSGGSDVYLLKTDSSGNLLWSKTYGGAFNDYGLCVKQTADSGFIIVGYTDSYGVGGSYDDVYLLKTDSAGTLLWSKTFGNGFDDTGFSVEQTADGGYILTGGDDNFQAFLTKIDPAGNLIWSKTFSGIFGGLGFSVQQTNDGGYIITGLESGYQGLIKTDSTGNVSWTKVFNGSSVGWMNAVQQTNDGGYILAGYSTSFGAGDDDLYLIKTDSAGNLSWSKVFGDFYKQQGFSVQQTTDGGYIISGITFTSNGTSDIYLIKTDANGNSGCHQSNPNTMQISFPDSAENKIWMISSGGTMTTSAAITANGCIENTICTTVGIIEDNFLNIINIFPNPASGYFTITLLVNIKKAAVTITDITGKIIYTTTATETQKIEVNTKDFAEGIYLVQIQTGGFLKTEKLIVAR